MYKEVSFGLQFSSMYVRAIVNIGTAPIPSRIWPIIKQAKYPSYGDVSAAAAEQSSDEFPDKIHKLPVSLSIPTFKI